MLALQLAHLSMVLRYTTVFGRRGRWHKPTGLHRHEIGGGFWWGVLVRGGEFSRRDLMWTVFHVFGYFFYIHNVLLFPALPCQRLVLWRPDVAAVAAAVGRTRLVQPIVRVLKFSSVKKIVEKWKKSSNRARHRCPIAAAFRYALSALDVDHSIWRVLCTAALQMTAPCRSLRLCTFCS